MTLNSKVSDPQSRRSVRDIEGNGHSADVRVLIADTHTLLRQSLAAALHRAGGLRVVAEAEDASRLLFLARMRQPEVVLLDPSIPGGGVALFAQLLREAPMAAILVLSHGDTTSVGQILQGGAKGYLDKNCELRDVVRAIERVRVGDVVIMAGPSDRLPTSPEATAGRHLLEGAERALTSRELEVLQLVVQGHSNAGIAGRLFITAHTVKGHLANILRKLGLENRVQLTAYATQHGLAQLIREQVDAPDEFETTENVRLS